LIHPVATPKVAFALSKLVSIEINKTLIGILNTRLIESIS